jgi:hypothetical protein
LGSGGDRLPQGEVALQIVCQADPERFSRRFDYTATTEAHEVQFGFQPGVGELGNPVTTGTFPRRCGG